MNPTDIPAGVERTDHLWITMPDGTRLGARLWLPASASKTPVPAVFEYIPYRKGDAMAARDNAFHSALASRGYGCLRVDMRGSGESDGVCIDEYSAQEQADGLAVLDWLMEQPWCNGSVGMVGISWGGIISLLLATHNHPALKAIIPVGTSDDRYYDDAGYYVGGLNGEGVGWGVCMFGLNPRPPDPAIVGERWREIWHERLNSPHFVELFLEHQHRDDYWRFASLREDYTALKIPTLLISGWVDCWPNTVPRLLERLTCVRRGIMGPWNHAFPDQARPGPCIDFVEEVDRWFRRWLKNEPLEGEADPHYLAWMQEAVPPATDYAERPGYWVTEPSWPSPNVERKVWTLGSQGLVLPMLEEGNNLNAEGDALLTAHSPQTVGYYSGEYMPINWFEPSAQLPGDQRFEDAHSLCFDSPILAAPIEILGDPLVHLRLACSDSHGLVAARLCDVAPDGTSTLISRGVLNLAHRNGREIPMAMTPGELTDITVVMNQVGYNIPAGHRLRVALSTSYWPLAWPMPRNFELTIACGHSTLALPQRDPSAPKTSGRLPLPAAERLPGGVDILEPSPGCQRRIETNLADGSSALIITDRGALMKVRHSALIFRQDNDQTFTIHPDDPLSATMDVTTRWHYSRESDNRDTWRTDLAARTLISCTETEFVVDAELRAYEGEELVFENVWQSRFPRMFF